MTPDAVIYRYLQIISADAVDVDALCALLSADADLLARWLKLLNCVADADQLRQDIQSLAADEFDGLAQAQAWTVLPLVGTARLSTQQWMAVLRAAFLAEVLLENLHEPQAAYQADLGRNTRLRMLLALSGVQLPHDAQLNQLIEYRGTQPQLLEDAALELRIFAVVDGLEFGREAELAEQLLGLRQDRLRDMLDIAERRAAQLVRDVAIDVDGDVDWAHRIWLRQQVVVVTTALGHAQNWVELTQLHNLVSRGLFTQPPLLLIYHAESGYIEGGAIDGAADLRIAATSESSQLAQAFRDEKTTLINDTPESAVVDRQLLKSMGCEQGLAVPVAGGRCLLLAADDEESDASVLAEMYAEQLGRYLPEPVPIDDDLDAEDEQSTSEQESLLAEFRAQESQRLREVVHEANNPLSIVQNYLHILELRLQHEPEAVEQLALIASELNRAADVFAQAREIPDSTQVADPAEAESVQVMDLATWMAALVELHSGYALEHGVALSSPLASGGWSVLLDGQKLNQIVGNLLKNAIEACSIGGEVTVGCRDGVVRDGHPGYEIFVEDNGPGIDPETLANIAGLKASSKGGEHQGVGLHLAYRLAAELGVALDVYTQRGAGTTFKLFVPLQPADLVDTAVPEPTES